VGIGEKLRAQESNNLIGVNGSMSQKVDVFSFFNVDIPHPWWWDNFWKVFSHFEYNNFFFYVY
jgi:hypothetical protein